MGQTADVLIVGAGIIGLCTALQLAKRARLRVTVLEKGNSLGCGSSGDSSAVCRHLYTHGAMVELARDGISSYKNWAGFLETYRPPAAEFQQTGVLWLGTPTKYWHEEQQRLADHRVNAEVIGDTDLSARFPAINPCLLQPDFETGEAHNCTGGGRHLLETEAGYMDPQYALEDLAAALADKGVRISFGTQVCRLLTSGGKITGAACEDGSEYHADCVVNTSGPWCNKLLQQVSLADRWPLVPTRIQVIYLDRPQEVVGDLPVCVDLTSGVYFRPQNRGQQIIAGSTLEEDEQERVSDPDIYNKLADDDFTAVKLHALHHRLPALPYRGKVGGYSGLYTINTADMHPLLGPTPVEGFMVANGFSGHGFKLAPAVGSLLAQAITQIHLPGDTAVPMDFLGWERTPIPLAAKNVLA